MRVTGTVRALRERLELMQKTDPEYPIAFGKDAYQRDELAEGIAEALVDAWDLRSAIATDAAGDRFQVIIRVEFEPEDPSARADNLHFEEQEP